MKRKYHYIAISMFLLAVVLYSCSRLHESTWDVSGGFESMTYEDVVVSSTDLPLFANLRGCVTKSSSEDAQMISLESLLDRDKMISKTFNQYELTEIPFKTNENPSYAVLSSYIPDQASGEYMSRISLFLVETVDKTENTIDRKVVTVIPDEEYSSRHAGTVSFINKGVFSGAVLYSDLDGSFRDVYVYGGDFCPIINADVIEESERGDYVQSGFLSVVRTSSVETKSSSVSSDGSIMLEPSICIATVVDTKTDTFMGLMPVEGDDDSYIIGSGDSGDSSLPISGGGGGGLSDGSIAVGNNGVVIDGTDGSSGIATIVGSRIDNFISSKRLIPVKEDVQKYKVSLYPTDGGCVSGSGEYQEGSYIRCHAIPDTSYVFDRWTGDLSGMDGSVAMCISKDVESTAYFHHLLATGPFRPCYDAERGVYNPLIEMRLAPTAKDKTNFVGSTFGMTRYSGTKEHNGLDLYAEPGTPVYAMYDGVISKKQRYVITQPDRNDRNWPSDYNGDKENAGNRFSIECEVDGETIYFMYWHMQAGTPVAINPRTGKRFKPGDKVYAGEVVGYTGKTGNAYNVYYKHLHLSVKDEKGKFLNPEDYINGRVQWNNCSKNNVPNTRIVRIKCDE